MDDNAPTSGNGDAAFIDRIDAILSAESADSTTDDNPSPEKQRTGKPQGDDQAQDQGPQITTADLAQVLGIPEDEIDVDEDGKPVFKTKIDGKEGKAKLEDFRKVYQLNGHADNRAREAAEKEKAAERKMQEAEQVIAQRWQQVEQQAAQIQQIAAAAHQELNHEYAQINWVELWQTDPGRAGLMEKQFQARNARINQMFSQAEQQRAMQAQHWQQQRQANEQQFKQTQVQRLYELIPEWKDTETANKEKAEMWAWIQKAGMDPQDLDLNRASQVHLLRRAWQHATLQSTKPDVENKVRAAPKLIRPGAAAQDQKDGMNPAHRRNLMQHIKGSSGRSTDAFARFLLDTNQA